jgi:hypothetical protein
LDSEREKIRKNTEELILEQQKLKEKEKDAVIESLKKSLEEAQRKANQGSQQLQGEVQELDLEKTLRETFLGDLIEPVGKGVLGADIRQIVKSPNRGIVCGTILWESKRTKDWSDGWILKLKEDVRSDKADIAAIVTQAFPKDFKNEIGQVEGVWICSPKYLIILSSLLRKALLDSGFQRLVLDNQKDKSAELYKYVTGPDFANQVEAMLSTYREMREQVEKERVAFEKFWKQREMQITRLSSGVSGIYGSISGIAGSALPEIEGGSLD